MEVVIINLWKTKSAMTEGMTLITTGVGLEIVLGSNVVKLAHLVVKIVSIKLVGGFAVAMKEVVTKQIALYAFATVEDVTKWDVIKPRARVVAVMDTVTTWNAQNAIIVKMGNASRMKMAIIATMDQLSPMGAVAPDRV